MKTTKISIADIKTVSNVLKMDLTPLEIDKILSIYDAEEENDPTASWELIVENCIYNVKDSKIIMGKLKDEHLGYLSDDMYLPIYYKGIKVAEPNFTGKGNHSVNQLEAICEQFKEYVHQQQIVKQNCMKHIIELKFGVDFKERSNWKLTDPDNFQYGLKLSESVFVFREFDRMENDLTKEEIKKIPFSNDDFYVELEIDLNKYTSEQIAKAVDGYYTSMQELIDYYGEDSNFIIAECIFETENGLY